MNEDTPSNGLDASTISRSRTRISSARQLRQQGFRVFERPGAHIEPLGLAAPPFSHGVLMGPGIATPELYDDELRIVRDNPYGPTLAVAFNTASIEYGRADFGVVDGKIQIYEINSNPMMIFEGDHPSAIRLKSGRLFKQNYFEALLAIDTI